MDAGDCTVPYFGFKAKPSLAALMFPDDCTVPYFGFKAKREVYAILKGENCTVPYFGFKAKPYFGRRITTPIVLCLILDSRQNCAMSLIIP